MMPLLRALLLVFLLFSPHSLLARQSGCDPAAWATAGDRLTDFYDVAEVAAFSSRMALPSILIEMHKARRAFERVELPECWQPSAQAISAGMYDMILGYELFVGESENAAGRLDGANDALAEAAQQLAAMGIEPDYRMRLYGDVDLSTAAPTPRPTPTRRPTATITPLQTVTLMPTATPVVVSAYGLAVGQVASIVASRAVPLRTDPSSRAAALALLPAYSFVRLVSGPVAADGMIWWQVASDRGAVGWLPETDAAGPVLGAAP